MRPPRLDGYEFVRCVGAGSMGVVHEAWDRNLGRRVAIKVLRPEAAERAGGRERLLREARALARSSHPNVVGIFDVLESEGRLCLVLEFVEGAPLDEALRRPGGSIERTLRTVEEVARGIDHAHRAGVVHRDLKPSNVVVGTDGRPRILDFGLARVVDSGEELTEAGTTLGTLRYMAPEQVRGASREATARTDVFALGVILYELLTGRPPFDGASSFEIYARICGSDPVPPRRVEPSIPEGVEAIALQALEKDPARRQPSAAAFADDLVRHLRGERVLSRRPPPLARGWARRRRAAGRLLAAAAAIAAGVLAWRAIPGESVAAHPPPLDRLVELEQALLDSERLAYSDPAAIPARIEGASRALEALVADHPDLGHAWYLRGRALELEGDLDGALAAHRQAIRLAPDHAGPRFSAARVRVESDWLAGIGVGRPEAGAGTAEDLSTFLELEASTAGPIERAWARAQLAACRGEPAEAAALATEGLEAFGRQRGTEHLAALLARLAAAPAGAEAAWQRALEARPAHHVGLLGRGMARRSIGREEEGRTDLEAARRFAPPRWPGRAAIERLLD